MSRRHPLPLLIALAVAAVPVACSSSDGRTLPPADPHKTTTTPSTPILQSPPPAGVFTLTSPSFDGGQAIPGDFTCNGSGTSPDLTWSDTPVDAAELAIVVRDRSADGYIHWVVAGIDPLITGFGRGGVPEGTVQAVNSAGTIGWTPPCPPAGSGIHTYEIALHALPGALAIVPGTPGNEAADLIEQASMAEAVLTVTYSVS